MAYQANDLVAKAVYCNNALNTAYDKWCKKSSISFIENNIQCKIKSIINQCLEEGSFEGSCGARHRSVSFKDTEFLTSL